MGYWIDLLLGKSKDKYKYVYLPKDEKWLFCFKKRKIIEHKDCDFYEHNCECDKNNDVWGRTHRRSLRLGSSYVGESCSILNENKNCELYKNGKINQEHKKFFKRLGKEYPFTEIR